MRKLTLILGVFFLLASCTKESSKTYCAYCTELTSGYVASPYCGSSSSVNSYMNDLESYDPAYPYQVWDCYRQEQ